MPSRDRLWQRLLSQYLCFCAGKASKLSTWSVVILASSETAGCRPCAELETIKAERQRSEDAKQCAMLLTASSGRSTSVEKCSSSRRENREKRRARIGELQQQSLASTANTARRRPLRATAECQERQTVATVHVSRGERWKIIFASISLCTSPTELRGMGARVSRKWPPMGIRFLCSASTPASCASKATWLANEEAKE